jgi:hypothetical protein
MTARTSNLMCLIVLIRLLQFNRTTECFELWVKWYFCFQDPVHLHIESWNIHIQIQVYSFISDPPTDASQKHEYVQARQYNACLHEFWLTILTDRIKKSKCLTRIWKGTTIQNSIIQLCHWCYNHIKLYQFSSKIPLGHQCYVSVLLPNITWCSFTKLLHLKKCPNSLISMSENVRIYKVLWQKKTGKNSLADIHFYAI